MGTKPENLFLAKKFSETGLLSVLTPQHRDLLGLQVRCAQHKATHKGEVYERHLGEHTQ